MLDAVRQCYSSGTSSITTFLVMWKPTGWTQYHFTKGSQMQFRWWSLRKQVTAFTKQNQKFSRSIFIISFRNACLFPGWSSSKPRNWDTTSETTTTVPVKPRRMATLPSHMSLLIKNHDCCRCFYWNLFLRFVNMCDVTADGWKHSSVIELKSNARFESSVHCMYQVRWVIFKGSF